MGLFGGCDKNIPLVCARICQAPIDGFLSGAGRKWDRAEQKGEVMDMGGLVHSAVRWPATPAGPARRIGLGHAFRNALPAPKGGCLVASHGEAGAFKDGRPRVVLRVRRRGVVLTVGAAGPSRLTESCARIEAGDCSDAA
jgi:hypothetical protein